MPLFTIEHNRGDTTAKVLSYAQDSSLTKVQVYKLRRIANQHWTKIAGDPIGFAPDNIIGHFSQTKAVFAALERLIPDAIIKYDIVPAVHPATNRVTPQLRVTFDTRKYITIPLALELLAIGLYESDPAIGL